MNMEAKTDVYPPPPNASDAAGRRLAWNPPTVRMIRVEKTASGTIVPTYDFPELGSTVYSEPES